MRVSETRCKERKSFRCRLGTSRNHASSWARGGTGRSSARSCARSSSGDRHIADATSSTNHQRSYASDLPRLATT